MDDLAYGDATHREAPAEADAFVDAYLLPNLVGSHRDDQLPYYLLLAAPAHPGRRVDLTYITGPLSKSPPETTDGQRYCHLTWAEVLPLAEAVWGTDHRSEVIA